MSSDKEESNNDSSLSVSKGVEGSDSINPDSLKHFKGKGRSLTLQDYVEGIKTGDRTILSRAITLIESTRQTDRELAQDIIERCLPDTGNSIRIGITGVPGVGKSTFIETLGNHIIGKGRKLAVLAIDPSSTRTRGSILGDKTRMETLANNPDAFIRPSPTAGSLGGVARKTRETIYLCEAAGYDTIFIETVGVGQSETAVHSMVDFFLLLMLAGAGDELQGIKRGIMEMADLIAINKADETNIEAANKARSEFKNALSLFPLPESGWDPPVVTCSALTGMGIEEIWGKINAYMELTKKNGYFDRHRADQAVWWMYQTIHRQLKEVFYEKPGIKKRLSSFENDVKEGKISSFKAANKLLDLFNHKK